MIVATIRAQVVVVTIRTQGIAAIISLDPNVMQESRLVTFSNIYRKVLEILWKVAVVVMLRSQEDVRAKRNLMALLNENSVFIVMRK